MNNGRLESEIKIQKQTEKKIKTMPDYIYDWYINLKASRKTAATCYDFIYKAYNFLHFIDSDVKNVKTSDITEKNTTEYFLSIQIKNDNDKPSVTSDSYQRGVWSCLNNLMEYLLNRNMIERNYIKLIQKPKNNDLDRINQHRTLLTENDFKKILNAINCDINADRNRAMLSIFMTTGMRKTALANIMMDDIDFNTNTLSVIDKGSKRHEYVLNETTQLAINKWLDIRNEYVKDVNDNHLFLSRRGGVMGAKTITEVVQKYTKIALGKPLSPHKLRSGYCSILYGKTHDTEFVRRAVGHSDISTTQRYIVTKGDEKKKASEIMASIF